MVGAEAHEANGEEKEWLPKEGRGVQYVQQTSEPAHYRQTDFSPLRRANSMPLF